MSSGQKWAVGGNWCRLPVAWWQPSVRAAPWPCLALLGGSRQRLPSALQSSLLYYLPLSCSLILLKQTPKSSSTTAHCILLNSLFDVRHKVAEANWQWHDLSGFSQTMDKTSGTSVPPILAFSFCGQNRQLDNNVAVTGLWHSKRACNGVRLQWFRNLMLILHSYILDGTWTLTVW